MKNKVYTAIGLMSGTSLDGVDCALIETDGQEYVKPLGFLTIPYTSEDRGNIRVCFGATNRDSELVKQAEHIITERHIDAIRALMNDMNLVASDIDVIGFHGQTIYHAPRDGVTIQIGDGALMTKELGIDVVDDFRAADVAAGGEGAPLAPIYHAARIASANIDLPVCVLNIGGVANVTWIGDGEGNILAFDTGTGNALMDDWIKTRIGEAYDKDGAYAQKGLVNTNLLEEWLSHPYFQTKPPKSLDRDEWDIAELGGFTNMMESMSTEDGAATLLAFTASGILKSCEFMPSPPKTWYACGGGRHNKALMNAINLRLGGCVKSVDDLGWDGDATEAECFAYLAVRNLLGLPISFPTTTRAPKPISGGVLHKA
jgi:anhydro-N-acetylmuramic acid kinase